MGKYKFRAWDKEENTMIVDEQGFIPLKVTNKGVLRLNPHHKEDFWEFVGEDRFEIMQFTGLKDSNNKEIYEGDIVTYIDEIDGETELFGHVEWENCCWVVNIHRDFLRENEIMDEDIEYKITGNIYEQSVFKF